MARRPVGACQSQHQPCPVYKPRPICQIWHAVLSITAQCRALIGCRVSDVTETATKLHVWQVSKCVFQEIKLYFIKICYGIHTRCKNEAWFRVWMSFFHEELVKTAFYRARLRVSFCLHGTIRRHSPCQIEIFWTFQGKDKTCASSSINFSWNMEVNLSNLRKIKLRK